jgi:uncharacterized protein YdcH (DUF465 family)
VSLERSDEWVGLPASALPTLTRRRHMAVDTHELKERLIASDLEFRDLSTRHHELDERLHELSSRHFLTEPEQLEEVQIKKQKLRLKDRMEDIMRRNHV